LDANVIAVELKATGVGDSRGLDRNDDVVPGAGDCSAPCVLQTVLPLEFNCSPGGDFPFSVRVWGTAVAVTVHRTEKDRDFIPGLFEAHLENILAFVKFPVGKFAGKISCFRRENFCA
jgi:hypothetical protein